MPTFTKVTPEEVDNTRDSSRGRVSYPIIKSFMETGYYLARVNSEPGERKPATLLLLLKSYCMNHDIPVKPIMRKGHLYLMRLDIDEQGNQITDWLEKAYPRESPKSVVGVVIGPPIDSGTVAKKK